MAIAHFVDTIKISDFAVFFRKSCCMDVFECIKTRKSIRQYSDMKIKQDDIGKLIEAALWAPSAKNRQPWSFCVIQNEELIT